MDAAFRRDYPWRKCDRPTYRKFCAHLGKQINSISKNSAYSDYEAGFRNVLNCEKTELDLEKLTLAWEVFVEQEEARNARKEPEAIAPGIEIEKGVGAQSHLARLRAMWRHVPSRPVVMARVEQNPDWGIVIGPNGPEEG
jgi:hypothetical protein